jgi:transposase
MGNRYFNLLEGSFEVFLANARHLKAVPGRKTDVKECEWLADLLGHGLIGASFIPPPPIRDLRDLTRHRKSLVRDGVKATNRVHKLLDTANIRLANVVSDVLGIRTKSKTEVPPELPPEFRHLVCFDMES